MDTQFITNDKGEKMAAIIPIGEYESFLHQHHLTLELTDDYKVMIDQMLDEEEKEKGNARYVSFGDIKKRFSFK